MKIKNLIVYTFLYLIVITDPYEGLDYDRINVYEINWCNYNCPYYNKEEPVFPWSWEPVEKETPYVYYSDGWNDHENNKELQVQSKNKRRRIIFNPNNSPSYMQIFQPSQ